MKIEVTRQGVAYLGPSAATYSATDDGSTKRAGRSIWLVVMLRHRPRGGGPSLHEILDQADLVRLFRTSVLLSAGDVGRASRRLGRVLRRWPETENRQAALLWARTQLCREVMGNSRTRPTFGQERLIARSQAFAGMVALEPLQRCILVLAYYDAVPLPQISDAVGQPLETTREIARTATIIFQREGPNTPGADPLGGIRKSLALLAETVPELPAADFANLGKW